MKSEIENNIGGKMREMKERLDTLTASLEENKDEGQLWFQNIIKKSLQLLDGPSKGKHLKICIASFLLKLYCNCSITLFLY